MVLACIADAIAINSMTIAYQRDTASFVSLLSFTSILYVFLVNEIGLIAGGLLAEIFAINEETLF